MLRHHCVVRAAALADEVLALAACTDVAAGAMAEMDVLDEADPLERLEVAIDRGQVGHGQGAPAFRDLLGAERRVRRVERLEHHTPRAGEPQPARAQRRHRLRECLGLHPGPRVSSGHAVSEGSGSGRGGSGPGYDHSDANRGDEVDPARRRWRLRVQGTRRAPLPTLAGRTAERPPATVASSSATTRSTMRLSSC